jgi:hypothetical protein
VGALRLDTRQRRTPERTVLYRVLADNLETFLDRVAEDDFRTLPRFVERELRAFLDCGILTRGFCRVHCTACGKDDLVAFSCKGRGFCPSCGTRRMVDTAAWLVDRVLPEVPVRQWVLALPHRIRFLCAYDPATCAGVRRILVRAVVSFYKRRARDHGIADPRVGCVAFTQRFDSALRLNVHFHTLWPDGVFTCSSTDGVRARFHTAPQITDEDIDKLARAIRQRVLRFLRKHGKLPEDDAPADDPTTLEPSVLQVLGAAAVQGRIALGPNAGAYVPRLGRGSLEGGGEFRRGKLCADVDGFSLHAGVCIPGYSRERLEKLCRYAARPPVVNERLSLSADGKKVLYKLKRRWKDGSTHVVLAPITLIERLAALVPRPRVHLTTYHGVFAPAASFRDRVVPEPEPEHDDVTDTEIECQHPRRPPDAAEPTDAARQQRPRRRLSWAATERSEVAASAASGEGSRQLLKRVFLLDVLTCPHCGGKRKLLAFLTDPRVVEKILAHLELPTDSPSVAPARPPPETALPFP